MNPFRSIVATLLAFLIASPLCCCPAKAEGPPTPAKSCCVAKTGEKKEKQKDCPCSWKAKEPREKAKDLELPCSAAMPLLPVAQDLAWLPAPVVDYVAVCATPHTGCDPPRLLLARYSRWLN